jgi:glycyl-tRNA synthetase beta chain
MTTTEFFIEVYSEEMPARMQKAAQVQCGELFLKNFSHFGIDCLNPLTFITPKRIVFKADISKTTQAYSEERRGPKETAPAQALNGFLASVNLTKNDLEVRDGYFYAEINHQPIPVDKILVQIIENVFKQFEWPKVMRYPQSTLAWVRPIRTVAVSLNGTYLPLKFSEGLIETSQVIHGHARCSANQTTLSSFDTYNNFLEKNYVILDHDKRQNIIKENLLSLAQSHDLKWHEDNDLLEEVAGLVEYPFSFLGNIDQKFMVLPDCVLITSMRVHQKYFAFTCQKTGKIAPYYCVVTNYNPDNPSIMLKNFDKVLKARLSDALFFYNLDVRKPLIEHQYKFEGIVYQQKLGSIKDKIDRMKKNDFFNETPRLETAIDLCKTDLLTEMVGEFPELQGKMGNIYAQIQGQSLDIAHALEDYYLPKSPTDPLPSTELSCQLSLLDKMDALVGFLGVGLKPSGSKDPYALRRQGLGIIRILLTEPFKDVDLKAFIQKTYETFPKGLIDSMSCAHVFDFIVERFYWFLEKQFSKKTVAAALIQNISRKEEEEEFIVYQVQKKVEALHNFLETEQGKILVQLYKRCRGLLGDDHLFIPLLDPESFKGADKTFYEAVLDAANCLEITNNDDYLTHMNILITLQPALSDFFRDVLINTECTETTQNRKALLSWVTLQIEKIANLRQIL